MLAQDGIELPLVSNTNKQVTMFIIEYYLHNFSGTVLFAASVMAMEFLWQVRHKLDLGVVITRCGLYLRHTLRNVQQDGMWV